MPDNFISHYLEYVGETEAPMIYHRWCCLSMAGTYLGRNYFFQQGHFVLCPNMYVMLMGEPGARKSTAIKIAKKVIEGAGYSRISADRSSKEKFLLDLAGEDLDGQSSESILDQNLFGQVDGYQAETYIACDEFNDFIGINNVEFMSILGSFWDFNGTYQNRIKNGKSISILNPTVSILGGNTIVNFIRAFPPEILGQGFFSRLLLIHGEATGKRITFPVSPSRDSSCAIVELLQAVKISAIGEARMTGGAKKLLDKIYKTYEGIDDVRFKSYSQRRFSHLVKLCLVISACNFSVEITESVVVEANTVLTYTEHFMPSALGEFGRSRNSDTTHKIMQLLGNTAIPLTVPELFAQVHKDVEKIGDLGEILRNLLSAGRIMSVEGGFLSKKLIREEINSDVLDYNYLTNEERKGM